MSLRTTDDGVTVYVAEDEREVGSKGPFYVVYRTPSRKDRLGFICSNCETVNNAMDPMGRLVCNACGNTKRPEEWDAVLG